MQDEFDPYYEWLGIAPHHRPLNHYLLLGLVLRESDRKRISNAADQRMAYLRNMQQGKRAELSQRLLGEVVAAANCLLNAESKQAYDASLPPSSATTAVPVSAPLPMSALTGPMAPVGAVMPEPAAPPRSGAADSPPQAVPLAAAPPVARAADASPLAPPKTSPSDEPDDSDTEDADEHVASSRLLWIAGAVACVALLASLVLGVIGVWLNWFGKAEPADVRQEVVQDDPANGSAEEIVEDVAVVVNQEGDGGLRLSPSFARLGDGLAMGDVGGEVVLLSWDDKEQDVEWRIRLVKPGVFEAKLTYATESEAPAGTLRIEAGSRSQQVSLRGSGGWDKFVSETFYIAIPKFGLSSLTLKPAEIDGEAFISLKSLELVPQ